MLIHIHPKYTHLKEAIAKIPEGCYAPLRTFCNSRNTVEQIKIDDCTFVVKKYKVPNFANRVIYTFFRRSKARRAYDNALHILRCGVSTPFPVAYIETKRKGVFHTGYFVSEYMGHPTLADYKNISLSNEESCKFKEDFLNFTIELHEKKILPLDYNTGKAILKLLQDTCREQGMTVILITHNSAIAPMADRVIHMKSGKVSKIVVNENPVPVETIEW